ncbi:MAG: plastoquinol--plastocyanin reductase [Acidobacteria bacterium]|nr:MAG: plastoquinol--plastocyanin reductase [Acidobacteriota bacterium]
MHTEEAVPVAVSPGPGNTVEHRSRRAVLKAFLGGGIAASLASFLYPVFRYVIPPLETNLGVDSVIAATIHELKPNSSKIFRFGNRPALLVRTAEGEYQAMAATCTHLSCTVQYRKDLQQVWCACHNGIYDLNGRNLSGPPPRPLEKYQVHVQGDDIQVIRT